MLQRLALGESQRERRGGEGTTAEERRGGTTCGACSVSVYRTWVPVPVWAAPGTEETVSMTRVGIAVDVSLATQCCHFKV